jgi:hypothetical protein
MKTAGVVGRALGGAVLHSAFAHPAARAAVGGAIGAGTGALAAGKGKRVKGALIGGGIGAGAGLAAGPAAQHLFNNSPRAINMATEYTVHNPHAAAGAVGRWATRTGAPIQQQVSNLRAAANATNKVASVVDVSALEPEFHMQNKTASRTALGGRFSLDSYTDVEDAITYFEDGWIGMAPAERHEFSVKTAARAGELGIEVPELMARYGSTGYAPDLEAHLANRRAVAPQFEQVWDDLQEKRAMIEPESFASLLQEADELVGLNYEWGGSVMDPYFATFGGSGDTEKLAWAWEGADGDAITEEGLRAIPSNKLAETFSSDFVEAFSHDPVTIFESMPDQHKVLISRMV